ncbi:hypothetical protein K1719_046792 [Acacia pycnantha]|nr:hypothetical protein K1719_046792 [Acacia pycnantha]
MEPFECSHQGFALNDFGGMQQKIQASLAFKSGHEPKYLHMFAGYCGKQDVISCLKVNQLLQRRCFINVNISLKGRSCDWEMETSVTQGDSKNRGQMEEAKSWICSAGCGCVNKRA